MKLLPVFVSVIALTGLTVLASAPAMAQGGPAVGGGPRVAAPVPPSGTNYQRYEFHNYLNRNPEVANALMKNPALANDPAFLKQHEELGQIIGRHPGLRRQLSEDPARVMERYRYHQRYGRPMGRSGMGPGMGRGMGPGGGMGPGMGRGMGPGGPPSP